MAGVATGCLSLWGVVRNYGYQSLHLGFFEALAEIADESVAEWRRISAGLLAVRAADSWTIPFADADEEHRAAQLAHLRGELDALDAQDPVREILEAVVRALDAPERMRPPRVSRALTTYAYLLEERGRWALAADVFRAALFLGAERSTRRDRHALWLHVGECHRLNMEWEEADAAFANALQAARGRDQRPAQLRACCHRATVAAERGAIAEAETRLREVEREADGAGLPAIRALARHARAHVALRRQDYEGAAALAYRALEELDEPPARDRALSDLAAAFGELGVRSSARDANLVIAVTTDAPYARWTALINLMEIAALDRVREDFEQWRGELRPEPLPPRLAGYFHYFAGVGARALGDTADARHELHEAQRIARAGRLAQLARDTEFALRQLDAAIPAPYAPAPRTPSAATASAACGLERMRDAVLAGAR